MKMSRYILVGILLGITLYKTEAVSWFRIFEMFHFQSFHVWDHHECHRCWNRHDSNHQTQTPQIN
jgi:hypothetical protein